MGRFERSLERKEKNILETITFGRLTLKIKIK